MTEVGRAPYSRWTALDPAELLAGAIGSPPDLGEPPELAERTARRTGVVPAMGCGPEGVGFEKRSLTPELAKLARDRLRVAEKGAEVEVDALASGGLATVHRDLPPSLFAADQEFQDFALRELQPLHEEWCGFPLLPTTAYGFRVYLHGAVLRPHLDWPLTHVISSTMCVDHGAFTPWELEVGREGTTSHVALDAGEMMLYESAGLFHGRPVPLNGRFYASIFLHYRPADDEDLWNASPRAWWRAHRPR